MKIDKNTTLKKILVINLGGIGDVLLSMPALRLLRNSFKDSYIQLLTIPRSAELFRGFDYCDDIIKLEPNFLSKIELFMALRANHFDLAINMRPLSSLVSSLKMAFLFWLVNAPYRLGRNTQGRGFFLNIKIPESGAATIHDLDYYFIMLEELGLKSNERSLELKINNEDSLHVQDFLSCNNVQPNDILIGISPGATWPSRRWPIENFIKLIELLLRGNKFKIVITGSNNEAKLFNKYAIINAAGKTNVGQLIELIRRCNCFISNDAGPMHLAAALHTPLIALFGPGDIIRYDPRHLSEKVIVMQNKISCAPCIKINCNSMDCFAGVRPEDVFQAILKLL